MSTLFVSHGAPSLALAPGPTGEMLAALAASLPRPEAILVVSAHWDTRVPTVSLASQPETMHDFAGFPRPSDIPVTQLSIQSRSSPAAQFALGQALQALHAQNILILASGAITHNLSDFFSADRNAPPLAYVHAFADWMAARIAQQQWDSLCNYRNECVWARQAHATEDHLMPLFVAAGSVSGTAPGKVFGPAQRYTPETTYGILAMDATCGPLRFEDGRLTQAVLVQFVPQ
ncbi:unnamed protein product [Spirodela intermedia]|uniref:Extradiol ring-cleavage dioxygenase class III enzyme subunit B domain-containing protein n=1 Tax=Spirodela intermedia TaxID=51605 RepID=A0ABN7EAA4_SPIIN|nr:unnamed protein product [Spirodela intermedia]